MSNMCYNTIKVRAFCCPVCHDIIYSRVPKDNKECSCENIQIVNEKSIFQTEAPFKVDLTISASKESLHFDWITGANKLGKILRGKNALEEK